MLVQLSPWQSVETSLAVTKPRRGRRRSDSQSSDSHDVDTCSPLVVASLVAPVRRYAKRKKIVSNGNKVNENVVPSLAITSSHRVSVLGRLVKSKHSDGDDHNAPPVFQESAQLQYSSRPGRSTSFLQKPLVNGSSKQKANVPPVPAILDAKNNLVYALQNENSTLCCWDGSASGPDDSSDSSVTKIALKSPALSLSLHTLKKGIVYGTCLDGSAFLGRWICHGDDRRDSLQMSYLEAPWSKDKHHAFTLAITMTGNSYRGAGQKRKANEVINDSTIGLHQLFTTADGELTMVKHEINLPPDSDADALSSSLNYVGIDLNVGGHTTNDCFLDHSCTFACPMGNTSVAVMFNVKKSDGLPGSYHVAHVCLEKGQLQRAPFVLPTVTGHAAGSLSPSILVMSAMDRIIFCDVRNGVILHSVPVSTIANRFLANWSVIVDRKAHRIAVLSHEGNHIQAYIAVASLEKTIHQNTSERVSNTLASGLRSTLATSIASGTSPWKRNAANLFEGSEVSVIPIDSFTNTRNAVSKAVDVALKGMDSCVRMILDPAVSQLEPNFFLVAYERAMGTVMEARDEHLTGGAEPQSPPVESPRTVLADNPQDAVLSSKGRKSDLCAESEKRRLGKQAQLDVKSLSVDGARRENGRHTRMLLNGIKVTEQQRPVRAFTPSSTPQRFLDGVMTIALSVLQLPKAEDDVIGRKVQSARLDARLILSRLIQSGKISARLHFETNAANSGGIEDTIDEGTRESYFHKVLRSVKLSRKRGRVFSPVDLIHDILTNCADVSEQLMVTMVDYILCRALPDDVAENLIDSHDIHHPYNILAKRYFNARTRLGRFISQNKTEGNKPRLDEQIKEFQAELDELSNKLLKAGAVFLVSRVVAYSRCNEALLRSAFLNHLPMYHEPIILLYILAELTTPASTDVVSVGDRLRRRTRASSVAATQWIAALSDAYRDRLRELPDETNETVNSMQTPVDYVRHAVNTAIGQSEAAMSLRDAFERAPESMFSTSVKGELRGDQNLLESVASTKHDAATAPPYGIEHLFF